MTRRFIYLHDRFSDHPDIAGLTAKEFRELVRSLCKGDVWGDLTPPFDIERRTRWIFGSINGQPMWKIPVPPRPNPARAMAAFVRRKRERNAPGRVTLAQLKDRIAYYGGKCWMCGEVADTIDHVKPLALGGSNWPANLRPACRSCNCRKGIRRV